jgi:hypothetical protein
MAEPYDSLSQTAQTARSHADTAARVLEQIHDENARMAATALYAGLSFLCDAIKQFADSPHH